MSKIAERGESGQMHPFKDRYLQQYLPNKNK